MNIPVNVLALETALDYLIKKQMIKETQTLDAMDAIELCTYVVQLYMQEVNSQMMGKMVPKVWH